MTLPIDEIRADIAARLAPLAEAGIFVRGLPSEKQQIGVPENGVITFLKIKDRFQDPAGSQTYRQNREMVWLFDVALTSLVGSAGAESITESIAQLLIGFRPRHCKKMYLERIEYMQGRDSAGRYVHEIEAIAPTLLVEDEPSDDGQPIMIQAVFEVLEINGATLDPVLSRATADDADRIPSS